MTRPSTSTIGHDFTDAPRSVLGNFTSIFLGRLSAAVCMWLAMVVLAKLSDPTTVGIYALAQAICIPVAEVAKMGLREVRSSDATGAYRFGDYLGLRLLATAGALVVMLASGLVHADSSAVLLVVVLYALSRCVELVSDIIHGLFQAHERMDHIGNSLLLLGPPSLLFLSFGYWLSGSLAIAVLGQLLAHVLVLGCYDVPVGRRGARLRGAESFKPAWEKRALIGLAWQALPLASATVLVMVAQYLPRLVVEESQGLKSLGFFAALLALAMAPSRLVHSMGTAVSVRLARHYATGQIGSFVRLLGRMVLGVAAFGTLGVALGAAFGRPLLSVVYSPEYAEHADLLVWLIAAASLRFVADVLQFGMIASRRFWWLALQYGVVAAVAVASCFTIIPQYGLSGAGVTMFLIFLSQLIVIGAGLLYSLTFPRPVGALR